MTTPTPGQPGTQVPPKKKGGCLKIALIVVGVLVGLLIIGSIAGGEEEAAPPPVAQTTEPESPPEEEPTTDEEDRELACGATTKLSKKDLRQIDDGLKSKKDELVSGARITLSEAVPWGPRPNQEFTTVLAVKMGDGEVATFATKWPLGEGLLIAVNEEARDRFTWGEATNPGSPMFEARSAIGRSLDHAEVAGCVETYGGPA